MRRATAPIEILLGFGVGLIAALCVQLPLVWFLHLLHLTSRTGFSLQITAPLGVEAMWSRVFWGGAFGLAMAAWGLSYPLGRGWFVSTVTMAILVRLFVDWIIVPIWSAGQLGPGWSIDGLIMPIVVNVTWALATALLLAGATLAVGTWGTWSPT